MVVVTSMTSTNDIMVRRSKVIVLMAQKQTLTKIAKTLNVSIDTIMDDKKFIESDINQFWDNVRTKGYIAFNQYMIMTNIDKVITKMWNFIESRNKSVSTKDKLSAARLILDAGNYQQKLFTETPELMQLKELEYKSNQLTKDNDINNDTNNNNNIKRKRLLP
jgi:hypothetical protein